MLRLSLILVITFGVIYNGISQSGLRVTKVSLSSGFELDAVKGLSEFYFLKGIRGNQSLDLSSLDGFDKSLDEMYCENANIRLGVTLKSERIKHFEFNLGIYKIADRFDAVEYTMNDSDDSFESLSYKSFTEEAGLELAIIKTLRTFKFLTFHAGIGTQFGYSYGSRLLVTHESKKFELIDVELDSGIRSEPQRQITETQMLMEEEYEMKNAFSHKGFFQAGFGLIFLNRIELGLMARYGLGNRIFGGYEFHTKLESFNFTMAYKLI